MTVDTKRDEKLVQYLNEAYGKEKELETALGAHIAMTDRDAYKKRLKEHLKETKGHARKLEQRIKKLGGTPQGTQAIVGRATALVKGPVHMVRGSSAEEKLLKNAKTEYSEEAEEIATYTAIEAFAESVGDKETAKLAREIRRDEEKMSNFLERLIPQLAKAVGRSEVPSSERSNGRRTRSTTRSKSSRSSNGSSKSRSSSTKSRSSRSRASSNGRRASSSRSGTTSRSGGRSRSTSR
jgi:ferritin-like metal-binding protein YciE